jgi:hypothetical protein
MGQPALVSACLSGWDDLLIINQLASADEMSDAAILDFPQRSGDRLRLALRRLDDALSEQRAAVATWRGEFAGLAGMTSRLGEALHRYHTGLDDLSLALRKVGRDVQGLDRVADRIRPPVPLR